VYFFITLSFQYEGGIALIGVRVRDNPPSSKCLLIGVSILKPAGHARPRDYANVAKQTIRTLEIKAGITGLNWNLELDGDQLGGD
jgi:hypothetical protein